MDWRVVLVTAELATVSTIVLLILGTPVAWWLSRTGSRFRPLVEALVALPLVLPPTVLGFYLLVFMSPAGRLGSLVEALGGPRLVFSFTGLVIGSVLYSLPFVVQPLHNAFRGVPDRVLDAAAALRAGWWDRFRTVVIPLARPGFLTAATLGFAHTVGEFGVVLMIGGNLPGRTEVLSIALYNHVEALEYTQAHVMAAGLLVFSLVVLVTVYSLNRRFETPRL